MTRYTDALTVQHKLVNDMHTHPTPYIKALIAWDECVLHSNATDRQLADVLSAIYSMVSEADTYFMSDNIQQGLLSAAHALPLDCQVHKESFPSTKGFLLLEQPLPSLIDNTLGAISAFSWWYTTLEDTGEEAMVLVGWWQTPTQLLPALYLKIVDGDTVDDIITIHHDPHLTEDAPLLTIVKFLVATFNFLEQQLLEPARTALPRQQRRQVERTHHITDPTVNVIRLRRRYVQHPTDPNHLPKDHDFQWMVRGHWRKQPYRSKGPDYYKYIFIAPHTAGPDDKPLKGTERVYAIVR